MGNVVLCCRNEVLGEFPGMKVLFGKFQTASIAAVISLTLPMLRLPLSKAQTRIQRCLESM